MYESDIILKVQQTFSSPAGRAFVGFIARWLIFFYLPFILFIRRSAAFRDALYTAGWTALLALTMSVVFAQTIGRIRPFLASKGIEAVVPPNLQDGSFPSSHTAVAVGIALALSGMNIPIGVAAGCMAALIAFGRVASGMHYPTDIIGGAAIGLLAYIIIRVVQDGLSNV